MYNISKKTGKERKSSLYFLAISIITAVFGIVGYIPGLRVLGSAKLDYIPMAPSTAISFILLSVFWILAEKKKNQSRKRYVIFFSTFLVTLFGFIKAIEYFITPEKSFESLFIKTGTALGEIPTGIMSASTGLGFFLSGMTLIFFILRGIKKDNENLYGNCAGYMSLSVIIMGVTFCLGYLYKQPFLYGMGSVVPMAMTTAVSFLFLGIGSILVIGKRYLPGSIFYGSSISAQLLRVFLPLILAVFFLKDLYERINVNKIFDNNVLVEAFSMVVLAVIITLIVNRITRFFSNSLTLSQKSLKESEERHRNLIETMNEGIVIQEDQVLTYVNNSFCRMSRYSKSELIGKKIATLFDEENLKKFKKQMLMRSKGKEEPCEIEIIAKDGGKVYTIVSPNIMKYDDKVYRSRSVVFTDITERKNMETEKKSLQNQLFQSQKMEAMGVLAGGIAHEFNNILTAIMSATELLLEDITLRKETRADLKIIRNGSTHAAGLTRQLLVFSRKDIAIMNPLEINKTVIGSIEMLEKIIGESITIELNTEKEDCYIKGNEGNIEQILMNMVINSKNAMPAGGKILISTKKCKLTRDATEKMNDIIPGEYVQVVCKDDGVGMTEEIKEKIFDPFFTTKGVGKGTGLGLSVVFGIVKAHNAYIEVYSNPGKGTTFNIYFPMIKFKSSKIRKEEEVSFIGNGEKLLVIEDDEDISYVLAKILKSRNYKSIFAESLAEAEAIYKNDPDSFDLVLCDMVLPDGNGMETIEKLNTIKPVEKLIFFSGYNDDQSHFKEILQKNIAFIHKPFIMNDLLKIISETLE